MPTSILIVEDDAVIRRALVDFLQETYTLPVDSAADGVEALHMMTGRLYDIIVLDLMMPKMSGVDVLDSMMAMHRDPSLETPRACPEVIVITAATEVPQESLQTRYPMLVRDVLRKPLDISILASRIHHFGGRRIREQ